MKSMSLLLGQVKSLSEPLGSQVITCAKTGISGISAAKVYLDFQPNARLVLLERDSCVGGTWNSSEFRSFLISHGDN